MQLIALQRDEELRAIFTMEVSLYPSHLLVFIDETGCDRRDGLRRFGYGLRGKPVKCQKLLVRGEHISVIAAMTVEGVLDLKIVRGTVTGDTFIDFIQRQLLPHLMTFVGQFQQCRSSGQLLSSLFIWCENYHSRCWSSPSLPPTI